MFETYVLLTKLVLTDNSASSKELDLIEKLDKEVGLLLVEYVNDGSIKIHALFSAFASEQRDILLNQLKKLNEEYNSCEASCFLLAVIAKTIKLSVFTTFIGNKQIMNMLKKGVENNWLNYAHNNNNDVVIIVFNVCDENNQASNNLFYLLKMVEDVVADECYARAVGLLLPLFDENDIPQAEVNYRIPYHGTNFKLFYYLMIERIKNPDYLNFYYEKGTFFVATKSRVIDSAIENNQYYQLPYTAKDLKKYVSCYVNKFAV